jgi:recombination protein RecA
MSASARLRRPAIAAEGPLYGPPVRLFPTGSTLLDLQNGGGWAQGRMVNIVGDSSSGKTLLAIEACANFARLYGVENARYCETEAAFDDSYAAKLGMPAGLQKAGNVRTVEDFADDLNDFLNRVKGEAALYCLDSVDALSSKAESERSIQDKATYNVEKAKALHEMFRRQAADIGNKNCCLFLISQTREVIGSLFAQKTRSGGRSLDFYASQIVWLHEVGKEQRTVSGVERVIGIKVRAQNKKNKVSEPFRTIDFLLVFNYGVDDELSMIDWLRKNRAEDELSVPLDRYAMAVRRARESHDLDRLNKFANELRAATRARWREIEDALAPPMRKYELA